MPNTFYVTPFMKKGTNEGVRLLFCAALRYSNII